jgi:CheY-like chemotaxis protein
MKRILIIDDDPDFIQATQMVLERQGYSVGSAGGGKAGYQKTKSEKPELIILDVMMDSVLDGVTFSRKVQADELLKDIPIIMVTSIANTDYAELFPTDEYIPVDAFLSKPIDPDKLVKKVKSILGKIVV